MGPFLKYLHAMDVIWICTLQPGVRSETLLDVFMTFYDNGMILGALERVENHPLSYLRAFSEKNIPPLSPQLPLHLWSYTTRR